MTSKTRKIKATITLLLTLSLLLTVTVPYALAAEDFWTTKEPMPTARIGLGAAVVDGKIYAIGGYNGSYLGTNELYDPDTDMWVTKAPIPTPRSNFGTAVVDNKIYVIGGTLGNQVETGVNEVYDPVTDTWENRTAMPTPRMGLDANVVNGKIYLIGGGDAAGFSIFNFGENEVYDPATDTWTTKEPIPIPVHDYASAVLDNKIYVIGGGGGRSNHTQIYDAEKNTWTSGTPIPTKVRSAVAGATTGAMAPKRIYVMGNEITYEHLNQVYDPEADIWTTGTVMPTPRFAFAIAVINDVLYAIGGDDDTGYSGANEMYTPIGYIPEFPSWTPLLITLVAVVGIIFVYRHKLKKHNQRRFNDI